jgi:hypothetical protein
MNKPEKYKNTELIRIHLTLIHYCDENITGKHLWGLEKPQNQLDGEAFVGSRQTPSTLSSIGERI